MANSFGRAARSIAALLVLGGSPLSPFEAAAQSGTRQRGEVLAKGLCGGCHAVGKTGESPHLAAPAFRDLDRQLDLDKFGQRLREGLLGTHRDMPMFRFTRDDAQAMVLYLRTIQAP